MLIVMRSEKPSTTYLSVANEKDHAILILRTYSKIIRAASYIERAQSSLFKVLLSGILS